MNKFVLILIISNVTLTFGQGQYSFEKYPAITYEEFKNWKISEKTDKEECIYFTLTIPGFYSNNDSLTIQLISFAIKSDSAFIGFFRNKNQLQKVFEPMFFTSLNIPYQPLRTMDINGDKLKDIKLVIPYLGNGLAALNERVIYLVQKTNGLFDKISFLDKMDQNRPERDFDGDDQFEIITMSLNGHENHNYWTFNIYNLIDGHLVNRNDKFDYPVMIQYLYKENYKVTDKISKEKMKTFSDLRPAEYSED